MNLTLRNDAGRNIQIYRRGPKNNPSRRNMFDWGFTSTLNNIPSIDGRVCLSIVMPCIEKVLSQQFVHVGDDPAHKARLLQDY